MRKMRRLSVIDGLDVEIDALPIAVVEDDLNFPEEKAITDRLEAIELQIQANRNKVDVLNKEIDRLTNHVDGLDYAVAAGCGVICGLFDSFFVGEFDWGKAKKWSYQKDGASQISRLLFEEATDINFYVGRAVNPAHQNPDLPITFNIKMNLVEELSECLKKMGKRIKVSYF